MFFNTNFFRKFCAKNQKNEMRALASLRKKEEKPAEAAEAKAEAASSPAESSKVETGGFLLISLFFAHSVGDRKRAEPREARRRRANGRQTA